MPRSTTWRRKYGGLAPSELKRLRQLEERNNKLKRLVADLMMRYGASMRKACAAIGLSRVVYLYKSVAWDNTALVMRIKDITQTRVHVMLKCEGFKDNHKRIYRLYKEQGLSLHYKRPKRNKAAQLRQPKVLAQQVNQIWSMDFPMVDNLFDGRKLRMPKVVDCCSRESLAIHVGQSLMGDDVVRVLNAIVQVRGQPRTIKTDNGSEFIGKVMDKWAYERVVELDFSRPGRPTDNAMVESFNGRLCQECLNKHWFMSLADAQDEDRARGGASINEARPHGTLDWLTPTEQQRAGKPNFWAVRKLGQGHTRVAEIAGFIGRDRRRQPDFRKTVSMRPPRRRKAEQAINSPIRQLWRQTNETHFWFGGNSDRLGWWSVERMW